MPTSTPDILLELSIENILQISPEFQRIFVVVPYKEEVSLIIEEFRKHISPIHNLIKNGAFNNFTITNQLGLNIQVMTFSQFSERSLLGMNDYYLWISPRCLIPEKLQFFIDSRVQSYFPHVQYNLTDVKKARCRVPRASEVCP